MAMSATPAARPVPAATATYRKLNPAANSIRPAVTTRHTDVPKSGSRRISAVRTPTTVPSGTSVSFKSFTRLMRRSSSAAVKKITASLAISEGWMPNP